MYSQWFWLTYIKRGIDGPEYAQRFIEKVFEKNIPYKLNTMVLDIEDCGDEKIVTAMNKEDGLMSLKTKTVIFSYGMQGAFERCTEYSGISSGRNLYSRNSPKTGEYGRDDAGERSRDFRLRRHWAYYGKAHDIGRTKVKVVAELLPYSGRMQRNIVQCLEDFDIPLKLSHTVVEIHGKERVTEFFGTGR